MTNIRRNQTPTFRLTPLEKPDMSPYLFHMTNRQSLKDILKDEDLENEETKKYQGKLKAHIPTKSKSFPIAMVCFTESPTFALDFFRHRWSEIKNRDELKYGIGFDKEAMVKRGVLPTFYVDKELQSKILSLVDEFNDKNFKHLSKGIRKILEKIEKEKITPEDKKVVKKLYEILKNTNNTLSIVKKLMFPLLENKKLQGFMWEREWRYITYNTTNEPDFIFSYEDIKIICCDDEDEKDFKRIIGEKYIGNIKFIRTWKEYNDITDFLDRRAKNPNININEQIEECLTEAKIIKGYIDKQEKNIEQIREREKILDEEIKKIALIKACEYIYKKADKDSKVSKEIKTLIWQTEREIFINALSRYYEYYEDRKSKSKTIKNPNKLLLNAINGRWAPYDEKYKKEIEKIINEETDNLS